MQLGDDADRAHDEERERRETERERGEREEERERARESIQHGDDADGKRDEVLAQEDEDRGHDIESAHPQNIPHLVRDVRYIQGTHKPKLWCPV